MIKLHTKNANYKRKQAIQYYLKTEKYNYKINNYMYFWSDYQNTIIDNKKITGKVSTIYKESKMEYRKFDVQLYYSEDDNGYYFQRFDNWKVSQLFATKEDAFKALKKNNIVWND